MLLLWAWVQVPFLWQQDQVAVQSHLWGRRKAGTRSWKCRPGSWPAVKTSGAVPCGTVRPRFAVLCENLFIGESDDNKCLRKYVPRHFVCWDGCDL